jgi:hypothetical protein
MTYRADIFTEEGALPFQIGPQNVTLLVNPDIWRCRFADLPAIGFSNVFEPDFAAKLVGRTSDANFVEDDVEHVGLRRVEQPQRIGKALSLLLHSTALLDWLESVTGVGPLNAVAGRLAETRCNGRDALDWHDDCNDKSRRLAVVINLSDQPFEGGQFLLRRKGESEPILTFDHGAVGSILIFAVRPDLEHCVTPVTRGGPRRVYAGWFQACAEIKTGLGRLTSPVVKACNGG